MNIKRKIYEHIVDQIDRLNAPAFENEVQAAFMGLTDDVGLHLEQLEREGFLHLKRDGCGEISLVPTFQQAPQIGLVGGAGLKGGSITLDLRQAGVAMPRDLRAIQVLDDSMVDAGMASGDVAILADFPPVPGDIVAVETNGRMILRRYLKLAEIPHFLAENPARPDLCLAVGVPIHGVLWASIRPHQRRFRHLPFIEKPAKMLYTEHIKGAPRKRSERSEGKRTGAQAVARRRHSKEKSAQIIQTQAEPFRETDTRSKWPEPPSGIQLNDVPAVEYRTTGWLHGPPTG